MKNLDMLVAEISRQFGVSRTTLHSIQSASKNPTVESPGSV
ncbi:MULTISPECIES: hypothetical protein [Burkholderia cepacia complex]|nr:MULTISPECIES: hypothetical protein [Burkholderia cepacia complex]MDN7668290.1 hypothetical protein [Burkholderia vietnamiensis]